MTADDWDERIDAFYEEHVRDDDPEGSEQRMAAFLAQQPDVTSALAAFELAGVLDSTGLAERAESMYRKALAIGLDDAHAARARIQLGSTLRNLGHTREAIEVLRHPAAPHLEGARKVFLALALHAAGRADEAVREAIEAAIPSLPLYRRSVTAYAAQLTADVNAG